MCFVVDLFQASSQQTKWLVVILIIHGVFSVFYLTLIILTFLLLELTSANWVEHWVWIFSGLAVLIWAVAMLTMTIIWCLCRNYAMKKVDDETIELGEVNEKVKKTLGLNETSNLKIKPQVDEIKIESAEITPLPQYSPEARNSIFDFSEESLQKLENERSHSPFQEFLHLVQVESPGTPEKPLHEQCMNRIPEEPMYDIPLGTKEVEGEENELENKDDKPLVDNSEKKLTKKKSQMFLGNIGKSSSVVSELFVNVNKGSVVAESVVVMGRYKVLSD